MADTRSITSWPSAKNIILCIFILSTIRVDVTFCKSGGDDEITKVLKDLPTKEDLPKYVTKLNKLMRFVDENHVRVEINFAFGLYLMDLNLRKIYEIKKNKLSQNIQLRLDRILKSYNETEKYFNKHIRKFSRDNPGVVLRIIDVVFSDTWKYVLPKFKIDLINKTKFYSKADLDKKYSSWPEYVEKVTDYNGINTIPKPYQSDECIESLSRNAVNHLVEWNQCIVTLKCLRGVVNGTESGYAITHRYFYLLLTWYPRGCYVFSVQEDKRWLEQFCLKIYNEAEYVAYNRFQIPDLIAEQITLCALDGHAQFIRRSWIDGILEFQDPLGCFSSNEANLSGKHSVFEGSGEWTLTRAGQNNILNYKCNIHTTGLAAATLASAIRYILETYY